MGGLKKGGMLAHPVKPQVADKVGEVSGGHGRVGVGQRNRGLHLLVLHPVEHRDHDPLPGRLQHLDPRPDLGQRVPQREVPRVDPGSDEAAPRGLRRVLAALGAPDVAVGLARALGAVRLGWVLAAARRRRIDPARHPAVVAPPCQSAAVGATVGAAFFDGDVQRPAAGPVDVAVVGRAVCAGERERATQSRKRVSLGIAHILHPRHARVRWLRVGGLERPEYVEVEVTEVAHREHHDAKGLVRQRRQRVAQLICAGASACDAAARESVSLCMRCGYTRVSDIIYSGRAGANDRSFPARGRRIPGGQGPAARPGARL